MSRKRQLSLPMAVDVERLVLGAMITSPADCSEVAGLLSAADFGIHKHQLIYQRITDLSVDGIPVDRVTITERLHQAGELDSVDGLSYLTSLDDGLPQIVNISAYCNIIREKAALRRIVVAARDIATAAMSGTADSGDLLAMAETSLLGIQYASVKRQPANADEILRDYQGGVNAFVYPRTSTEAALATGFTELDELLGGGFREGELIILAARPAMGKSTLAMNIAQNVTTRHGERKGVVVFSLEMTRENLLQRVACAMAHVDAQKQRAGYLNRDEADRFLEALQTLTECPLYIDDTAGLGPIEISSKVRRLQSRADIGLVVVDYLQLMQGPKKENRVQEVSFLSRSLKLLARDLRIPFLVLSQLSRAPELRTGDHRPILSDLRESGSIEQDADIVLFIFREEVYRPDKESVKGLAELLLAKQRNGPVGKAMLSFIRRFTRFENFARGFAEEGEFPFEDVA